MKKLKRYILILTLIFIYNYSTGQLSPSDIWLQPETDDFATIQHMSESYFQDKDQGQGSGYKQWKRWEYMNQNTLTPDGKISNFTIRNLNAYREYFNLDKNFSGPDPVDITHGSWSFLAATDYVNGNGWNPGIGRVNCIAFHPTNPNIFYIGMPCGGLWKTTDGGSSWTCLTDGMPSIGVSGIVVHPTSPNTIYILTGDGDGGDSFSIGVMKTINGGINWNYTGLEYEEDSPNGFKLVMHPNSSNILFAVTSEGVFKTTNSGSSWYNVVPGNMRDLEFKPGDPSTIYASSKKIFCSSNDTGETWDYMYSGLPDNFQRIAIGVTPANPNYVYLLTGPAIGEGSFTGVFLSTDSGSSFDLQSDAPNILGYSSIGADDRHQTWYDLSIVVSRTDAADVMTGGINVWVSGNHGVSWTISSMWSVPNSIGYTHADIHALEINPINNYLYCASDGGIFRSTDFGINWTDLSSGIANTQFYRIAGVQNNSNLITGGTQDNGSNKWTGGTSMQHILGDDGMDCMIDYSNNNILYNMKTSGKLQKSIDGGASFDNIKPAGSSGSWLTPIIMDPINSNIIYGGYESVYKSTNGGGTWINTGAEGHDAMAIGTSNPDWVYASVSNKFYRSENGAENWNLMYTPDYNTLSFMVVDPGNPLRVFATIGGYDDGKKVYRTTNGGNSWTNISGSLPNVPIYCIAYEEGPLDALYIGTGIGVFYRNNDIGDWIPFMNGLPTVIVNDLEINYSSNLIRAGTFGRGLWSSPLYSECPASYNLTPLNDPSNPNYTGFQYYEASYYINSSRIITGGPGTDVTYKAGNNIRLEQGFNAIVGTRFNARLGPCEAKNSEEHSNGKIQK